MVRLVGGGSRETRLLFEVSNGQQRVQIEFEIETPSGGKFSFERPFGFNLVQLS